MAKYLITAALPYSNGPCHLGHLAGAYLPSDVHARFRRLNGDEVLFVCGTDEHGVPITIHAEQLGITPEDVIQKYHSLMADTFEKYGICFDHFSGTHREEHKKLAQQFFLNLLDNHYISTDVSKQFYDDEKKKFLPDRYVEGTCPNCGYDKARGDQCDNCGTLLDSLNLINPKSILSHTTPSVKETKHWYLELDKFQDQLEKWISTNDHWKDNVRNFILGWIKKEGLHKRAITRDLAWGIPVPLDDKDAQNKVLYVWFEAPIGYISASMEWAQKIGKKDKWKDYWLDKETKLIHFIGKDNIPFHAIIWPAIEMGQKTPYILPYDIPANEYLTLEGEKISTSRNWAIWAHELIQRYSADSIRYTLEAGAPENKDSDFSFRMFQMRNNEELADNLGNLVNRVLVFIKKTDYKDLIPDMLNIETSSEVIKELEQKVLLFKNALENYKVRDACKILMDIGRLGNRYFDESKPWILKKENSSDLTSVLYTCMAILDVLAVCMYPLIPFSSQKLWDMIGSLEPITDERWDNVVENAFNHEYSVQEISILFEKFEDEDMEKEINKLKESANEKKDENASNDMITIDEFSKIHLKVGEIIEAEAMSNSRKLIKMQIQVGSVRKQILSGIKDFFNPEELVGKKVVIVDNLKPARMGGELSEGMILCAATPNDEILTLLDPGDIPSGAEVN